MQTTIKRKEKNMKVIAHMGSQTVTIVDRDTGEGDSSEENSGSQRARAGGNSSIFSALHRFSQCHLPPCGLCILKSVGMLAVFCIVGFVVCKRLGVGRAIMNRQSQAALWISLFISCAMLFFYMFVEYLRYRRANGAIGGLSQCCICSTEGEQRRERRNRHSQDDGDPCAYDSLGDGVGGFDRGAGEPQQMMVHAEVHSSAQ